MNNANKQFADQGSTDREYEYERETQKEKQSVGSSREFVFSYPKNAEAMRKLKIPRSQAYMDAVQMIDVLSAADHEIIERLKENMDEETVEEISEMTIEEVMEEIMRSVREELEEAIEEANCQLIGILSKCYITGCDVHAIDSGGNIIDHFNIHDKLSEALEHGREIFHQHEDCRCVEVYGSFCLVVNEDSSVTEIKF